MLGRQLALPPSLHSPEGMALKTRSLLEGWDGQTQNKTKQVFSHHDELLSELKKTSRVTGKEGEGDTGSRVGHGRQCSTCLCHPFCERSKWPPLDKNDP